MAKIKLISLALTSSTMLQCAHPCPLLSHLSAVCNWEIELELQSQKLQSSILTGHENTNSSCYSTSGTGYSSHQLLARAIGVAVIRHFGGSLAKMLVDLYFHHYLFPFSRFFFNYPSQPFLSEWYCTLHCDRFFRKFQNFKIFEIACLELILMTN